MISREELIKSKEYWLEKIQNSLFVELENYIKKNNLNKTKFAEQLGVSKSYLSQVLNGNFDHKLSKFIELSLAIDKIPLIKFEDIDKCLALDSMNKLAVIEKYDINVNLKFGYSTQDFPKVSDSKKNNLNQVKNTCFVTSFSSFGKVNDNILA